MGNVNQFACNHLWLVNDVEMTSHPFGDGPAMSAGSGCVVTVTVAQ